VISHLQNEIDDEVIKEMRLIIDHREEVQPEIPVKGTVRIRMQWFSSCV
jgi:hypothetical protein